MIHSSVSVVAMLVEWVALVADAAMVLEKVVLGLDEAISVVLVLESVGLVSVSAPSKKVVLWVVLALVLDAAILAVLVLAMLGSECCSFRSARLWRWPERRMRNLVP